MKAAIDWFEDRRIWKRDDSISLFSVPALLRVDYAPQQAVPGRSGSELLLSATAKVSWLSKVLIMKTLYAEKWGPLGAILAAACCLGLTWLVSLVTALGAGFLIRDSILMPLLLLFLGVSIWGLWRSYRRHSWVVPLTIGSSGAALLLVGMFMARPLSYVGIALLVAAPLLDLYAQFIKERPSAAKVRTAG